MKKNAFIIASVLVFSLAVGIAMAQDSTNINKSRDDVLSSQGLREASIRLADNSQDFSANKVVTTSNLKGFIEKDQISNQGNRVSEQLMTYEEFVSSEPNMVQMCDISNNRMVYVVKTKYTEYSCGAGLFKNALVTQCWDAATGEYLEGRVNGDPKTSSIDNPSNPN